MSLYVKTTPEYDVQFFRGAGYDSIIQCLQKLDMERFSLKNLNDMQVSE
jgi:hypothetical protein